MPGKPFFCDFPDAFSPAGAIDDLIFMTDGFHQIDDLRNGFILKASVVKTIPIKRFLLEVFETVSHLG